MKTTLAKVFAIALMVVALSTVSANATGTLAGTLINNNATVTYKDVNANPKAPVTSNTITTTVNPVCGVDTTPASRTETVEDKTREYAFTITNTGNDYDSLSLALSGVPAGWTATMYHDTDGDGTLDAAETTVTSSTGALHPTAPTTISENPRIDHYHVIVQVSAPLAPTVVNETANITLTATCTHSPAHPNPKTDTSTIAMTVQQAVISVAKVAEISDPMPLQAFDYTITVSNLGNVQAYGVTVTDTLLGSLAFIGPVFYDADGPGTAFSPVEVVGAYSGGTITVSIGSLGAGITATITFEAQVKAGIAYEATIGNTASVSYDDANAYSFTSTDVVTITVANRAGVDIAKSFDDAYTDPGDFLVIPFTIENTGNGEDVVEITISQTGALSLIWTIYFDVNGNGIYDTGDIELENTNERGGIDTGSLAQGAKCNLIAVAAVPAGAVDASVNALTISASSATSPTEDDSITITHTVKAPILTITKAVDKATANPGDILTYTITVTNTGTGNATSVVITDSISAILAYVDYVLASIRVDNVAQTDAIDSDYSSYAVGVVTVNIPIIDGTLTPTPNVDYVITLQVTIK